MLDEAVSLEVVRRFCNIATHRLGVGIDTHHHALVAGRVAKRLALLQVDVDEYMSRLDDDRDCCEVVGFLDVLRPRAPRFFARRDDHLALCSHLIDLLKRGRRRLRLWSAGCGSGEEAYSMAATALGAVEACDLRWHDVDIKILATDISKTMLDRGRHGVFQEEQLRGMPRAHRDRFFHTSEDGLTIDEAFKDMVHFRRLNLTSLPYPMTGPLDAIFCHEGLKPLVPSARSRVARAVKDLLAEQALLCTGFAVEDLAAADDEDHMVFTLGDARSRPDGNC
jgi:chemotaxis protein methyltransferase CheR